VYEAAEVNSLRLLLGIGVRETRDNPPVEERLDGVMESLADLSQPHKILRGVRGCVLPSLEDFLKDHPEELRRKICKRSKTLRQETGRFCVLVLLVPALSMGSPVPGARAVWRSHRGR
jgi:hypothetical protein